MSGEPMALKVVNKINANLKFLYRKNKFLATFYALQCSYPATFWLHGNQILPKKTKKKIQITQNKCIRFCDRLDKMQHTFLAEFRSINWFPTKERLHQCKNAITFKFVYKNCTFLSAWNILICSTLYNRYIKQFCKA